VQKETAQELLGRQRHALFLIALSVILPEEGDLVVVKSQEAVIADRDTMGIASQIGQHVVWATKRRLGVDDPVLAKKWPQECAKGLFLLQGLESTVEGELTLAKSLFQAVEEFAAKNAT
jgi:hypothetical protein